MNYPLDRITSSLAVVRGGFIGIIACRRTKPSELALEPPWFPLGLRCLTGQPLIVQATATPAEIPYWCLPCQGQPQCHQGNCPCTRVDHQMAQWQVLSWLSAGGGHWCWHSSGRGGESWRRVPAGVLAAVCTARWSLNVTDRVTTESSSSVSINRSSRFSVPVCGL